MLVLSRRKDESIIVCDNVEIMIVDVRGNKVRLGITAPKSVPVHRKEVYEALRRKKVDKTKTDAFKGNDNFGISKTNLRKEVRS